jgi:hypothetical protein
MKWSIVSLSLSAISATCAIAVVEEHRNIAAVLYGAAIFLLGYFFVLLKNER